MTRRLALLSLSAIALAAAGDPLAGVWKANVEKSKQDPNHKFSQATMRFEIDGDKVRLIIEGVNQAGRPVKQAQEFNADGKERPALPGDPGGVTVTATRPDARSLEMIGRKDRKVVGRGLYEVSEDGRTLTATTTGTDEKGREYKAIVVFDRQ